MGNQGFPPINTADDHTDNLQIIQKLQDFFQP